MKLDVKVFDKGFVKAMGRVSDDIADSVGIQIKQSLRDLQTDARQQHRYKSRGFVLEKSIQTKMLGDLIGAVYLDTGIAIYGPRIHSGFGTWKPDRFLYQAAKNSEVKIKQDIRKAYNKGFKKAGL